MSGAIGGLALWALLALIPSESISERSFVPYINTVELLVKDYAEWYAAFAVPGFWGSFFLVATLFIGFTGRLTDDSEHEFWGRAGSWILNASVLIGAVGAIIIFGPGWVAQANIWASASLGGAVGIISLVGGFSAKTLLVPPKMTGRGSWWTEYGVRIATPLSVILLIVTLALGTSVLVKAWSGFLGVETKNWNEVGWLMPEPYDE